MKLTKPTLLLDEQKTRANIEKFVEKSQLHNVAFRPHFKTHQSAEVGRWFNHYGVEAITVSSVSMAIFFAANGWDDITLAFPVNINEYQEIDHLAARCKLNLTVENSETVEFLNRNLNNPVGIFLKIDAGYHRTGIEIDDERKILELAALVKSSKSMRFEGFLVHNGHTYHAKNPQQILQFHNESIEKLRTLKSTLKKRGIEGIISIGDTPALSLTDNLEGIDEIRPGNFVFYDLMQQHAGACHFDEIAVVLACPVVAKHHSRKEIVIHGGAVHLSKEFYINPQGQSIFGEVVRLTHNGWSHPVANTFVKSLSQEHGIIKAAPDFIDEIKIGDFIGVVPVHSCLAVAAMRRMFTLSGTEILLHPWD